MADSDTSEALRLAIAKAEASILAMAAAISEAGSAALNVWMGVSPRMMKFLPGRPMAALARAYHKATRQARAERGARRAKFMAAGKHGLRRPKGKRK